MLDMEQTTGDACEHGRARWPATCEAEDCSYRRRLRRPKPAAPARSAMEDIGSGQAPLDSRPANGTPQRRAELSARSPRPTKSHAPVGTRAGDWSSAQTCPPRSAYESYFAGGRPAAPIPGPHGLPVPLSDGGEVGREGRQRWLEFRLSSRSSGRDAGGVEDFQMSSPQEFCLTSICI